ncbi:MAG: flavodoxin-dependent (E)-4-hydroxy-3-methylbut-2-enyl-diphosphate synthase [Oscillospiraceae bacterium]|jgi:(E)-4-hydroxy-3-methylbut-2-enyl-diphosphate synthase
MTRADTRRINVGGVPIGGGAPVTVQSMCNTKTEDVPATLAQIERLREAGCDIVRLAVPNMEAARALGKIKEKAPLPIVADIHFDYRLAIEAVAAGADKIRINPGNIGSREKVKAVADACRAGNIPIRIGVNSGSLERELLAKYGAPTARAMAESARRHVELLNSFDFDDICLSLKASSVPLTVEANRLAAEEFPYPLHLGITEAGTAYNGLVQSAVGLGALLCQGIGDTIRVSLTADPVEEVKAGIAILKAAGLRKGGVRLISCPSCGRCGIDLIRTAEEVESLLAGYHRNITVAVMGCVVNGPGEAREADYGLAGGQGAGVLFKKGEVVGKVPSENLARALVELIKQDEGPS